MEGSRSDLEIAACKQRQLAVLKLIAISYRTKDRPCSSSVSQILSCSRRLQPAILRSTFHYGSLIVSASNPISFARKVVSGTLAVYSLQPGVPHADSSKQQ